MTNKRKKAPQAAIPTVPAFRIEADGSGKHMRVTVSGIIGIREFSETAVGIATKRELITFVGEQLTVTVFESRAVEISGKVKSISIDAGKRGGRRI